VQTDTQEAPATALLNRLSPPARPPKLIHPCEHENIFLLTGFHPDAEWDEEEGEDDGAFLSAPPPSAECPENVSLDALAGKPVAEVERLLVAAFRQESLHLQHFFMDDVPSQLDEAP
jgi:hypothetical protein